MDTQSTAVLRFDVHDEAIAEQRVAVAEEERELGADGRCVGHHEVSIGPDGVASCTLLLGRRQSRRSAREFLGAKAGWLLGLDSNQQPSG